MIARPNIQPGVFVAVVGPSGAGKDSILRAAAAQLSHDNTIVFARRIVTRIANSDEDHGSVTQAEFTAMKNAGAFALDWQANELSYGIPAVVHDQLAQGHIVVANASRAISNTIKTLFSQSLIIHITAKDEVLRHRLAIRGREAAKEREQRLARSIALEQEFSADIRIENNDQLEDAIQQFVSAVSALKSYHADNSQ